ncbi:DNA primase [Iodobacter ciconiae]|uniref:DNA primase n=1 Tax=Iodobacter ciconiae TaxID=2496266 RepID=A0A3S8ZWS3_9NEIS|nr:DNA primase [Iodobacter ciconiae]AZN37885.1 DNA primase [Iodobacter ciconiae]
MAKIPDDFIQDLLNRVDIVDVVERYLPLKKAGQNYSACCPFHKEKSPSFTVSQTKQFYHCFGCGAHGSAVGFVMEHQGMSFPDAVRMLAESVGMQVPVSDAPISEKAKAAPGIYDVLKTAMNYYRAQLKTAPAAIEYLKSRGVEGRIAARFGLGFAPSAGQSLKTVFADYDKNPVIKDAGLVAEEENTLRRYDRFRSRVLFPILNQRSQVIGFGGRIMGNGAPKYLNSPETPVFEKGKELYGLPQARAAIRDRGRVLVVEGYMDVVMLNQHGVEYAVASLGTACTPEHIRKLLKLADEVYFCFDGDKAGKKAAWRALENSLEQLVDGKKLAFLFLPAEHDPDSYVQEFGQAQFENALLQDSVPLAQFLLKELSAQVELESEEGRAKLISLAAPMLNLVRAPAFGMMIRKRLAELARLEMSELSTVLDGSPVRYVPEYVPSESYQGESAPESWQEGQGWSGDWQQQNSPGTQYARQSNRSAWKSNWQPKSKWKGRAGERIPVHMMPRPAPRAAPTGPVHKLIQLVLAHPDLVRRSEPVWLSWPETEAMGLAQELLQKICSYPDLSSLQIVESWQGMLDYDVLHRLLISGGEYFDKASEAELDEQLAATLKAVEVSVIRPMMQERFYALTYKQANGGLTEAEKLEFAALVSRR